MLDRLIGQPLLDALFLVPQAPETHEELIKFQNSHAGRSKTTSTESPSVLLPTRVLMLDDNS